MQFLLPGALSNQIFISEFQLRGHFLREAPPHLALRPTPPHAPPATTILFSVLCRFPCSSSVCLTGLCAPRQQGPGDRGAPPCPSCPTGNSVEPAELTDVISRKATKVQAPVCPPHGSHCSLAALNPRDVARPNRDGPQGTLDSERFLRLTCNSLLNV